VYKRTKWYVKTCCMKILNVDVPSNRFCEIMLLDEKRFKNFFYLNEYKTRKMDGVALMCFILWQQSSEWLVCLPMLVFNDGRNCCGNSMRKWEREAPWWKDKHLGILVVVIGYKYVWVCLFVVITFYKKMFQSLGLIGVLNFFIAHTNKICDIWWKWWKPLWKKKVGLWKASK
jgi:hypothetical protein